MFAQSDWSPSIQDGEQVSNGSYVYAFDTGVDSFPRPVAGDGNIFKYFWGYAITDGVTSAVACEGEFLAGRTWVSLEEIELTEDDDDASFYENVVSPRFGGVVLSVQPKEDLLGFYTDEQLQNNENYTLCFYSGYQKDSEPPVYKYVTKDISGDIAGGLNVTDDSVTDGGADNDAADDGAFVETDDSSAGEQQPTTLNPKTSSVTKPKPQTLHLYSTIFGEDKQIVTSSGDRGAVSRTVQGIFGRIFSVIFTVAGIIMVVMLAVHGTRMIYSEFNGNVPVFSDAKKQVVDIAKGAAILMLSWVILSFVDPNLLRPRLFQTITQLSEVGSGAELYSNQIEIPEGGVDFNQSERTVTLARCPQIVDDRFRNQVEGEGGIAESLRGERKDFYQILYSKFGEYGVHAYDEEGIGSGKVGVKYLACAGDTLVNDKGEPIESTINLPPTTQIVVVFPVVSIVVEESKKGQSTPDKVMKKIWRGVPKKYDVSAGTVLTELADKKKEDIKLTQDHFSGNASVGFVAVDGTKVSELVFNSFGHIRNSCNNAGQVQSVGGVQISFGSFQNSLSVDGLTLDHPQYVLKTKIRGSGYEQRDGSQFFEWNQDWHQDDTHTFCLDWSIAGFKVIPQFSTTNSSAAHNGVPVCYEFIKKSGTKKIFEGVKVVDC